MVCIWEVILSPEAVKDLDRMCRDMFNAFNKGFDSIAVNPFSRHMKHGMPFYKKRIGGGRIVYQVRGSKVYIARCFTSHKEYDKWSHEWRR